jgi:hypothetical protein
VILARDRRQRFTTEQVPSIDKRATELHPDEVQRLHSAV